MSVERTVLLVEPYGPLRHTLARALEEDGHLLLQATGTREALVILAEVQPHLILLSVKFPRPEVADFQRRLAAAHVGRGIPLVLLSPRPEMPPGVAAVLEMPFGLDELRAAVTRHALPPHGLGAGAVDV